MRRVIVTLCLALLFSCAGAAPAGAEDGRPLTAEALLEDFDYLWTALERDYIFFPVLAERGVDVAAVRGDTRTRLEDMEPDLAGFYSLLEGMFGRMEHFGHLGVLDPYGYEVYHRYYGPGTAYGASLCGPETERAYALLSGDGPAAEPDASLPAVSYDGRRKALTLRIYTFDAGAVERDRDVIAASLEAQGDKPVEHIIFDIRGNGGGSDAYWRENLVAPFGGTNAWKVWSYLRDTEMTRAFYGPGIRPLADMPPAHMIPDFVEELGLDSFLCTTQEITSEPALGADIQKADRWVLVDHRVYSAAEAFCQFCKETGWATLVGQRTLGDGGGGSPIPLELPNSGLVVRFDGTAVENAEGALSAAAGTTPDFLVGRFETAEEVCGRLIDEME